MQGFYAESWQGEQAPLVLVTLKTGEGIAETRLRLAILEGYEVFACKNGQERETHETSPCDLLPASSLPRGNARDRGCREIAELHPHLLR